MNTQTVRYHYSHEEHGQSVFQPTGPIAVQPSTIRVFTPPDLIATQARDMIVDYKNPHLYVLRDKED